MRTRRVLAGARIKFAGIAISKVLMFAFALFVARVLGVSYFGKYAFAFAYASLWAIVMDLGLSVAVMRDFAVSREEGQRMLSASFTIKIGASAVGFLLLLAGLPFLHVPKDTAILVVLIGAGTVLDTYARLAAGVFRAREDLSGDAAVIVIQKVVFVGLAVVLVLQGVHWLSIGAAYIAGWLATLVWSHVALGRRHGIRPGLSWDIGAMRTLLAVAMPLALVDFFTLIYFRIDTVMLEAMRGEVEVGLYNAAYRLIEAAMIFPMAFLAAAFAGFAKNWETDRAELLVDYRRSTEWMMAIAAPGVAVGIVLAPEVIAILFGDEFAGAVLDLRILLLALACIYPNYVLTQILIAGRQQKAYAVYVAACAAFNVGLNFVLIPRFGHAGAAAATVATELLLLALCLNRVTRRVGRPALKKIGVIVCLSVLLGAATWGARVVWVPAGWILAIPGALGIVHYGVGLHRLFASGADEDRH